MGIQQFFGSLQGRGPSPIMRSGTKDSGIEVWAQDRDNRVEVRMWYDDENQRNMVEIELTTAIIRRLSGSTEHGNGPTVDKIIYRGELSQLEKIE